MKRVKSRLAILMAKQDPPMNQRELAERSGVSAMAINRLYRNDFKRVDTETLEKLCAFFRCDLSELLILTEVGKQNNFPSSAMPSPPPSAMPSPPPSAMPGQRVRQGVPPQNIPHSAHSDSRRRKKEI